jgi:plastocyanin
VHPPIGDGRHQHVGTTHRRGLASLLIALGAAVVLAACSGTGFTDRLVMTDFAYTPETVRVPAEQRHLLEVVNDAELFHDITVEGLPEHAPPVHLGVFGGRTAPYDLPPLPAGEYELYCSVEGHAEAGMVGRLVVE